jgi:uncharacterized protein
VHISELADRFINDPNEVVKVQQKVRVTVLEVDLDRKRISLSMRSGQKQSTAKPAVRPPSGPRPSKSKANKPENRARQPFHNPLAEALARLKRS